MDQVLRLRAGKLDSSEKKMDTGPRDKSVFAKFAEACVVYTEPTLVLKDFFGRHDPQRH